jgi:MFS family permease
MGSELGFYFFVALGGAPFAGFLRKLGVNDLMYSVMMAMPAMGGVFQLFAAYFLERTGKTKKMFLISGIFQRLPIIPVVLLPLFVPEGMENIMFAAIFVFLGVSALGAAFNGVSFFSWMAALIPIDIRGRFFGQRQMMFYLSGMLGGFLVGFLLDTISGFIGFAVVFVLVTIMALLDIACFLKVKEPPFIKSEDNISFAKVRKKAFLNRNFLRYTIFWAVWIFGVAMPGPFFITFMLEYLKISFVEIAIYAAMMNIFIILFGRIWGSFIDRFANRPVLYICSSVIAVLPLVWFFAFPGTHHIPVAIVHILAGMFWGGIELTSANLMMGLSPDKNRSVYIANFSVIASLAGSMLPFVAGGLLMQMTANFGLRVSGFTILNYHILFVVAALIRLFALIFLLPHVREDNSSEVKGVLKHTAHRLKKRIDS